MSEKTYTQADMARAWDEGLEWRAAGEYIHPDEYYANPYREGAGDE